MPKFHSNEVQAVISLVCDWAAKRQEIGAAALVGSWARGEARSDSDVDFMVLTDVPEFFRSDLEWIRELGREVMPANGLEWQDEDYGAVWSRRLYWTTEIEISFGSLDWAKTDPVDSGTREVVASGAEILYDPLGLLQRLFDALDQA